MSKWFSHTTSFYEVAFQKRIFDSSRNGADFLQECVNNFNFEIKNVQTDNGSEFLGEFDKLCKKLSIPHCFIYPRHPKQNTYVETSHALIKENFTSKAMFLPY
jgi:transposase InsO family protein